MKPEATKDDTPKLRIHSFPRPRRIRYGTTVVTRAMSITTTTRKRLLWMWNSRRLGNRKKRLYNRGRTIDRIVW